MEIENENFNKSMPWLDEAYVDWRDSKFLKGNEKTFKKMDEYIKAAVTDRVVIVQRKEQDLAPPE